MLCSETNQRKPPKMALFVYLIFTLFSLATACDQCILSKATVFSNASSLLSGSCGYDSFAFKLNGGHVAAGVPSLYKSGAGCGACFQIRCKNSGMCSKAGAKVMLTDENDKSNSTDFIISSRALRAMALPGKDLQLINLGIVDIQYKRIPCDYKGQNLAIRVVDAGRSAGTNLAINVLYQGGQTEIVSIDVAQVGSSNWSFMSRKYGAVWEASRLRSSGPLQFRFVVTSGFDGKYIWAKNVLPANWKPGVVYDTGLQIDDIALEGCKACDDTNWN